MSNAARVANAAASPTETTPESIGWLAAQAGQRLPLLVCQSRAGYYIGTLQDGLPLSRESVEYWPNLGLAEQALRNQCWTQRRTP